MFIPRRILFEKNALSYPIGKQIHEFFAGQNDLEIIQLHGNKIKANIPGDTLPQFYQEGKSTLVVGVKKPQSFQTCKPSAHYQLPLLSGCIGQCQYCYLNTNMGDKPYMRINVNAEELLSQAEAYILQRHPEITVFEGSATSDPVPVEPYSGLLKYAIEFFGRTDHGRFRFVTKYTDVDTLLALDHRSHTEIRFTLNTNPVIRDYESRTPSLEKRLAAAEKVIRAGYPTGFLIAPVFLYDQWREDYRQLLSGLKNRIPDDLTHPLTFEVISHRYTPQAKKVINGIFPDHRLPMSNEERSYKYGQFGYGKYVYPKDSLEAISEFFRREISEIFHDRKIEIKYII
jgi:spore photoproduct lyase